MDIEMKILHICTGWPLSFQGGITNYVRQLAETQNDKGHEVHVLGAPDKEKYSFHYEEYTSKIRAFSYCPLVDKKALQRIKKYLERERFEIIHIHALEYVDWDLYEIIKPYHYVVSLHDYCFICPRVYMYKNGKPCTNYDEKKCSDCISFVERIPGYKRIRKILCLQEGQPHIPQNITKIRYKKFLELLNNSDYILPVSNRVEEIYKASGITSKSRVLHIGNISADVYNDDYEYKVEDRPVRIVFLGRLTEYKGANLFIKIAKEMKGLSNLEFHFCGYAGEYEAQLNYAGVINHGKYKQSDLGEILKAYDMGMVLSVWEDNGPQVVMELLNNHVPVIGTKMGGIQDFVTMENGYIFNPYNDDEVEGLYNFLRNITTKKVSLLKNNIKRTTTSVEHYNALMDVYNEIVNK